MLGPEALLLYAATDRNDLIMMLGGYAGLSASTEPPESRACGGKADAIS